MQCLCAAAFVSEGVWPRTAHTGTLSVAAVAVAVTVRPRSRARCGGPWAMAGQLRRGQGSKEKKLAGRARPEADPGASTIHAALEAAVGNTKAQPRYPPGYWSILLHARPASVAVGCSSVVGPQWPFFFTPLGLCPCCPPWQGPYPYPYPAPALATWQPYPYPTHTHSLTHQEPRPTTPNAARGSCACCTHLRLRLPAPAPALAPAPQQTSPSSASTH